MGSFYRRCWVTYEGMFRGKKATLGGMMYVEDSKAVIGSTISAVWYANAGEVFRTTRRYRINEVGKKQISREEAARKNKLLGVRVGD